MQPVSRNPFAPGGHFWRHIPTRPASGSLHQRTGTFRLPPATPAAHARHLRHIGHPAQTGHSAPRRPEVPFHSDRTFRLAQTEYSTRCRQAMLRTAGHSLRRGRHKKRDGSPLSTQRQAQKKRDGSPHSAPQGEPDIVTPHPAAVPQFAERFPHKSPVEPGLHGSPANLSYKYSQISALTRPSAKNIPRLLYFAV